MLFDEGELNPSTVIKQAAAINAAVFIDDFILICRVW